MDENNNILYRYAERIYNKDSKKVLSGEDLYNKGLKYLLDRQEEKNIDKNNS